MKYKSCFIIGILFAVFFSGNFLFAQSVIINSTSSTRSAANFTDMYNLGINVIDPVLPDSMVRHGLKLDDVHERAKQGIESAGWTQNQASPYFVAVIITLRSSNAQTQVYTVEAEWGTDQSSLGGNPNGMGTDESLSKTVVLSSTNYSLILAAATEVSRQAARKLQAKLFRELMQHPHFPAASNQLGDN
jgi:hypothetical protein